MAKFRNISLMVLAAACRHRPSGSVALAATVAELGVDGLLRDKPRIPGKPPLPRVTVERVLALTCSEAPGDATHWTARAARRLLLHRRPPGRHHPLHRGAEL